METTNKKITILSTTTTNPISLIGERAGYCWGADISDPVKNYKRGLGCLKANHGRTLEYPNIEIVIEGYSARFMREYYTHIGCLPSRLQGSTRYIDYSIPEYIVPYKISQNEEADRMYNSLMTQTFYTAQYLEKSLGIPREDSAMVLPLAMSSTMVDKRNLRNLIDMANQRLCTRAYWEFREFFRNLMSQLAEISEEWAYIVDNYLVPKCVRHGYCEEHNCCGRAPSKAEVFNVLHNYYKNSDNPQFSLIYGKLED